MTEATKDGTVQYRPYTIKEFLQIFTDEQSDGVLLICRHRVSGKEYAMLPYGPLVLHIGIAYSDYGDDKSTCNTLTFQELLDGFELPNGNPCGVEDR